MARVTAYLSGSRSYWRLRALAHWLRFRLSRIGFRFVVLRADASEGFGASRRLIGNAAFAIAGAAVGFACIWALHRWRLDILSAIGLEHGWLWEQATRKPSGSSYDTMLQALAGVGGVFLALYFAAVSTVAANVYAAAPHNIRNLMLRDREGSVYVKRVALLTSLSALLLLARSGGAAVWLPAIPVLAFLALISVYAFVRLGQRTFYFSDPTILAPEVERDFARWTSRACQGSYRAGDPAFQQHYGRVARAATESFVALAKIATRDDRMDSTPAPRIASAVNRTLRNYLDVKSRIPSSSRWFGQRPRHKQWFLTSAMEVSIAGGTMTSLQPELVPDREWVEEALTSTLSDLLRAHLETRRFSTAALLLVSIADTVQALSRAGQAQLAMRWSREITDAVLDAVTRDPPANAVEEREMVAVLDTQGMLPSSVSIGMLHQVAAVDIAGMQQHLSSATTIRDTALNRPLPPSVKEHLESVAEKLEFEFDSHAPVRTPPWFVAETTLNTLALALEEDIRAFIPWAVAVARDSANRTHAMSRPVETAAVASRGVELSWRMKRLIEDVHELASHLEVVAMLGDDLQRPRWEWASYPRWADALEVSMVERLVETIPDLAAIEPREDIPDYLGEAVHRGGEACYDALVSNNAALFARLYPRYFHGTRTVADRVRVQLMNQHPIASLPWLSEPIIDLFTISGSALVFAEFHDNADLWHVVRDTWDADLAGANGPQVMDVMAAIINSRAHQMALGPRDMIRTWDQRTDDVLRELPATTTTQPGAWIPVRSVQHTSPLIRELADDLMGFSQLRAHDVFLTRYLMSHPLAQAPGISFDVPSHRTDDLRQLPILKAEQ